MVHTLLVSVSMVPLRRAFSPETCCPSWAGGGYLAPGHAGAIKAGPPVPTAQDWGAGSQLGAGGLTWLGGLG